MQQKPDTVFQLLGIAQDAGYPHPFCKKPCCERVRNKETREQLPVAAAVVHDYTTVLIDATPALPEQLEMLGMLPDAIVLTHAHIGHYTGLMYLGREAMNTSFVPVYCTPKMSRFLQSNAPWSQLVALGNIDLREVLPGETIHIGSGIEVEVFEVVHRSEYSDVLGIKVRCGGECVVYVPDADTWDGWPVDLSAVLADASSAYLDCTFYHADELPGRDISEIPHPLVEHTLCHPTIVRAMERMPVYAIHLNHTNPLLLSESHPVLLNTLPPDHMHRKQ